MISRHDLTVRMIPIDQIAVVNTRLRGQEKFKQIVSNIASLGLKKPVLVSRSQGGKLPYDLVCGEGRINAFRALGETEIAALVINVSREDLLLMSLAENIARKPRTTLEMAREIGAMRERGNKPAEIARKVGLDPMYVAGIIRLLKQGEERLIVAVERRKLPFSVAITIAETSDEELQRAMGEAYEKGDLRGPALKSVRRLIEKRRLLGKGCRGKGARHTPITAETLVRAYKKESARQQMLVSRARLCETRLRFVVAAVKKLLAEEAFVTLLRAEGLTTLPQYLAAQVSGKEQRDVA